MKDSRINDRRRPRRATRAAAFIAAVMFATAMGHTAPPDRAAEIDRRLAERARQINESPRDPALLADQAADYYFEHLAVDGTVWTVLLGAPSRAQRERFRRASREVYELARRAEAAIEEAIFRIEASPDFADNLDLQRERRRLVEEERDRRIPFLVGVGASLRAHGGESDAAARASALRMADEVLGRTAPRLTGAIAARARLHAGLAARELGRADDAMRHLDEAEANAEAEPIVAFAARLLLASTERDPLRSLERLAAHPDYSRSIFHRLLIADRMYEKRRTESPREAVEAYVALLDAPLNVDRQAARDIVLARIADAVSTRTSEDGTPIVVIAMAERAVRTGGDLRSAAQSLERLLRESDANDLERMHALLTLARLHHRAGDSAAAAAAYFSTARLHADRAEAPAALEAGLALAADLFRSRPAAARDVLHEGLTLAFDVHPNLPSIARWRYVAGRLATQEGRYTDAIDHLGLISADHDLALDAGVLRLAAMRRAAAATDDPHNRATLLAKMVEAIETLSPELARAQASATPERAATLRRHSLHLRILHAAAIASIGQQEKALEMLEGVETMDEVDGLLLAEALQTRIEAFQTLGQTVKAQQQVDQFLEQAAPAQVTAVIGPMLQSIEARLGELKYRGRDEQASELVEAELAPLAQRLSIWMHRNESRFDPALALKIADAHRLAYQFDEALALYDRLLVSHPNALPLLLGRAECLYHLGVETRNDSQLAEAITIYRRLISAGSDVHEVYWQAQLRALQILDATGRNTHQIAPQIQRLRLRDPELGGDQYRPEFDRLQSAHAG